MAGGRGSKDPQGPAVFKFQQNTNSNTNPNTDMNPNTNIN